MTAAERKRLQVERDRARAKRQLDLVYVLPRPPFGTWLDDDDRASAVDHLAICYDGMNREPPNFQDDNDPVSASGHFEFPSTEDGEPSYRGALGRAELEVDLLIEAAKTLADLINDYKREVIADRIRQIELHDLDESDTRKERLKEIVELNKALERLDRSVRAELPQWQLRG
ncbi:hypothetical protein LHP98_12970 [Rhodobacter sp. Har01]|uniref:hypothetical protein n=1 Tax=Rhodobacter sp. Har01 TaxID=2883999 RepID=UPI001D0679D2|nr:hypothetical protein [Rhodobacter sp. Har01]MCB6179037.1 hypothetical protein [Rhodobacter sp. Har01]